MVLYIGVKIFAVEILSTSLYEICNFAMALISFCDKFLGYCSIKNPHFLISYVPYYVETTGKN